MGIDTIGLDRPCFLMFKEFLSTKDKSKIWPCHFLGRRREYCQYGTFGQFGRHSKALWFYSFMLAGEGQERRAGLE